MLFNKTQTPQERLHSWRELRQQQSISVEYLIEQFSQIPVQSRYIDFYTPESWPSVFDIVSEGMFCQSGITLVLAGTMYYAGFITSQTIVLPVISNSINGNTGLVLQVGDRVYNLIPGQISSVCDLQHHTQYTTHVVPVSKLYS
jgi:hypothetical protein